MTYDRAGNAFGWDNTDIRYANTGIIEGTNIVYGITANNNPTVQDVWNSTPAWSFPYITSAVAQFPVRPQCLGGAAGPAGWRRRRVCLDRRLVLCRIHRLSRLGRASFSPILAPIPAAARFANAAPYWRFAYEKKWDKNSLMFGTFGMYAESSRLEQRAQLSSTRRVILRGPTNPFLDIGVDTQYQWIGEENIVSLRASYIWERQKLNGQSNPDSMGEPRYNPVDYVNDFNISASYIYDRKISLTVGHFEYLGNNRCIGYLPSSLPGGDILPRARPIAADGTIDFAFLPFSDGGPDLWPWFNARLGIQYTHYDRFDGSTSNSFRQ